MNKKCCPTCYGTRLADISAKCSDMFSMTCESEGIDDYLGYALCEMNIGGDDYVEFEYCLDCGQMAGNWPVIIPDEAYNG